MAWDELDRLERMTYGARKGRMRGDTTSDEAERYETRLQRAEMGDDLDDY